MQRRDQTDIGGMKEAFLTTHWSLIEGVKQHQDRDRALIGMLIGLAVLCLTPVAFIMYFIAMVYYGYQSYQGKRFNIPGLTNFLHDQGWLYN